MTGLLFLLPPMRTNEQETMLSKTQNGFMHLTSQQKLLEVHEGGLEGEDKQQGTGKGYSDQADESDNLGLDGQSVSTFSRRADSSYLAEVVVLHAVGPGVDEELVDDGDVQEVHHVRYLGQGLEDAPGEELVDQAQT